MPCFDANASARVRSRAATAAIVASSMLRAGLMTADGAMRAAPRMPIRRVSIGAHCKVAAPTAATRRGGAGTGTTHDARRRRPRAVLGHAAACHVVRERVDAAVAGGFAGISLWGRDYAQRASRRPLRRRHPGLPRRPRPRGRRARPRVVVAARAPSRHAQIPAELDTEELFAYGEAELFRIAEAVGARSLNAIDVFGGDWTRRRRRRGVRRALCDRAAEHGLLVHLEFLPWSRIPDRRDRVGDRARAPTGRTAGSPSTRGTTSAAVPTSDALRAVPGDRVLGHPARRRPAGRRGRTCVHATLHERLLPGDGELDLAGLARRAATRSVPSRRSASRCSPTSCTPSARSRRPAGRRRDALRCWRAPDDAAHPLRRDHVARAGRKGVARAGPTGRGARATRRC